MSADDSKVEFPPKVRESFIEAFATNSGSLREQCACGREFYDTYNTWDWDEGEFERLAANPNATPVPHAVGKVYFEGTLYAMPCDCWHQRAARIAQWLEANRESVVKFLNLERDRALSEAARMTEAKS